MTIMKVWTISREKFEEVTDDEDEIDKHRTQILVLVITDNDDRKDTDKFESVREPDNSNDEVGRSQSRSQTFGQV